MEKVFVTLVGNSVAVASDNETAARQVTDLVLANARDITYSASYDGEVRRSIRVRMAHVTVNQ